MSGLDILIPCKGFSRGKSRLAPVLSAAERAALCRELLLNTVSLARTFASRIAVVSEAPEVLDLAAQLDVVAIPDNGTGLNAALLQANAHLLHGRGRNALLVLPIDLPLLDQTTLGDFLADPAPVVIAPDAKGKGTNLLGIDASARSDFEFCYGFRSFDRHCEIAASRFLALSVFQNELTAFDLDEPDDLECSRG